jgi:hypothetical protein
VIRLQLADLGPATVLAFLDYLETERHNCAATRNCRLIAIHRFFAYVADRDPRHVDLCRRFPYTAMTGGPAKIIASANGCTLPPAPHPRRTTAIAGIPAEPPAVSDRSPARAAADSHDLSLCTAANTSSQPDADRLTEPLGGGHSASGGAVGDVFP